MSDTRMSQEARWIRTLTCATCAYFAPRVRSQTAQPEIEHASDRRGHCRRRLQVSSTLLPNGSALQSAFYPEITGGFPCCGEYERAADQTVAVTEGAEA